MTYAALDPAEPIVSPASLGLDFRTVWGVWRAMMRGRTDWVVLLVLFAGLELADIITTNVGLGLPGNWEANPLMAMAQAHLGAVWWAPKAVAVFFVCVAAPFTRRRWFMILAVGYCTLTVSGNLLAV